MSLVKSRNIYIIYYHKIIYVYTVKVIYLYTVSVKRKYTFEFLPFRLYFTNDKCLYDKHLFVFQNHTLFKAFITNILLLQVYIYIKVKYKTKNTPLCVKRKYVYSMKSSWFHDYLIFCLLPFVLILASKLLIIVLKKVDAWIMKYFCILLEYIYYIYIQSFTIEKPFSSSFCFMLPGANVGYLGQKAKRATLFLGLFFFLHEGCRWILK